MADRHIRAFNRTSGALLWAYETKGPSGGSATIVDSTVFVGSWDKNYYALNGADGSKRWVYASGGEIESHGAYADGVVYITAEESHALIALDSQSGKEIWKYDGPSQEMNGSPSLSNDLIYVCYPNRTKTLLHSSFHTNRYHGVGIRLVPTTVLCTLCTATMARSHSK